MKYRNELKYVCTQQELCLLEQRIKEICKPDKHTGEDGTYTIRSVYFDDYQNTCFYENENGTDPREKFRIRIYDGNTERITLECKRKEKGKNHKFTCPLTKSQCEDMLQGQFTLQKEDLEQLSEEEQTLLRKFFLQYRTRLLRAKVIVEYDRTPYIYETGNVRITFDRNIRTCGRVESFLDERILSRPVMPAGKHILEVKYDEFLPNYLYNGMQIPNLQQTAYSKYYICRKFK